MRMIPRQVVKGIIYKRCSKCYKYVPLSNYYYRENDTVDKTQGYCKECHREELKKWRDRRKINEL